MAKDSGVLEKQTGVDGFLEARGIIKIVINAVRFAGAGRAGGAGNDAGDRAAGGEQLLREGSLASAGGSGEDDQQRGRVAIYHALLFHVLSLFAKLFHL